MVLLVNYLPPPHTHTTLIQEGGGPTAEPDYSLGYVSSTGVDFLCQGFTEFLLQERVEYGWLMKLVVGKIAGTVSVEQVRVGYLG